MSVNWATSLESQSLLSNSLEEGRFFSHQELRRYQPLGERILANSSLLLQVAASGKS